MATNFLSLPHRAVRRHRISWPLVMRDGVLVMAITWLAWWVMGDVAKFWTSQLNFWMARTGVVGHADIIAKHGVTLLPAFVVSAPTLLPTIGVWWLTALACALVWGATTWLKPDRLPLIYFLRLVVLVQVSSLVFFYAWPESLPTTSANFLADAFRQSAGLMLLVPALFALTLYLFALPWWAKYGATAAALLYFLLFVPLQVACEAWILQLGGILFLPTLYLFFGLLPQVIALMGIYSFALSFLPPDDILAQRGELSR
jgi:hypothetical protein